MKSVFRIIAAVCIAISSLLLPSCASHPKPVPDQVAEFEPGMKALADNLAEQLENSSLGNILNKIVVNPLTKQGSIKKIVVDPFIDTESGYPVRLNPRIYSIMSSVMEKRFAVTGAMEPENLEVSEYVVTGMVSKVSANGGHNTYKVDAAVFEKASGVVHASAEALITGFDATAMQMYEDNPMELKGQNYQQHVASVRKKPTEAVEKGYHEKLGAKSMRVKGDSLYEQKAYEASLAFYSRASDSGDGLESLKGAFTTLVRQGRLDEAGKVYGRLLRASISETNGISSRITFGPNSKAPLASKAGLYNLYMREIAALVAETPSCRVKIIGHCSKTGSEGYNEKLSLQRAVAIQKQIVSYAPGIAGRVEALGRGYQDSIIGTGKDDLSDEVDRRVEFKFSSCGK